MAELFVRNLTNQTIEFYLAGGRYLCLRPGGKTSVLASECEVPAIKKMQRNLMIEVIEAGKVEKSETRKAETTCEEAKMEVKKRETKKKRPLKKE